MPANLRVLHYWDKAVATEGRQQRIQGRLGGRPHGGVRSVDEKENRGGNNPTPIG